MTLYGQSSLYWAGNDSDVNELSPSFRTYLSIHPIVFAGMGLVWIGIFSTLIAILPEKIGMTISIAVVIGHMFGAASWLALRFESYQSCNALFLLTSIVIVTSFNMGHSETGQTLINWSRTRIPSWTRWIIAMVLVLVPVWWFLDTTLNAEGIGCHFWQCLPELQKSADGPKLPQVGPKLWL